MKKVQPYIPGIFLFLVALVIGMLSYQEYGMSWDEPISRQVGNETYNYVFNHDPALKSLRERIYGTAFELPLIFIEKWGHISDSRDIYLMRHIATHIFFLVSVFCGYILIYRLFKNQFLACLGFVMLVIAPRIYAHSFFNSKDIAFLSAALIVFMFCQVAFEKNKAVYYMLLGAACGYAAGIRIMGVMFAAFILLFLLVDMLTDIIDRKKWLKPLANIVLFLSAFCVVLLVSWPYLWDNPIRNFIQSYQGMSHFPWVGSVLFKGAFIDAANLPWYYFPVWFVITTPPVWLIAGFAGMVLLVISILKRPMTFARNGTDRHFLFYLLCFMTPVLAVIFLHSVLYDDWRHLYFVYPGFVLMALYGINSLVNTRFKPVIIIACIIQAGFAAYFMVGSYPFEQVYFNSFVPHSPEYLRKNYELDYWGCGYKQALERLVKVQPWGTITINREMNPLENNIMMLPDRDRKRMQILDHEADYKITTFRGHPEDFPYPTVVYSVKVLNSTILCVYKTH